MCIRDSFRRWYVDGRIFFQKIIDAENTKNGITELKYLDPRKVKKIREVRKRRPEGMVSPTNINIADETVEYFVYNERGIQGAAAIQGIKIAVDTIAFCPSGMIDQNKNGLILSYLHKAIKPVNQLRMIEDAAVIYRIARAPERRIFKIDVGNLPKAKAESYLRDVMARYRNKLVYDASTGEIRDDRNYMSMLEDFWLPSREGGRGTDISTLPGGQNLGEISDIEYFRAKLYRSLKRNSTIPFEFVCISDTDVEADVVLPYNHQSNIKKHWHKLKYFSPQFAYQKPGDEIIVMDIDQVITGNVDELIGHPVSDNEIITYGQWWDSKLKINGGFYKFKSGSLKSIWDDFALNPEYWQLHFYNEGTVHKKYYGEQNYVKWKILEHRAKLTKTPSEWIAKYTDDYTENLKLNQMYMDKFDTDYMILDKEVNEKLKVVHFTGVGRKINENYLL